MGPGVAGETATVKTGRVGLGSITSNASANSDGITLLADGETASPVMNLSLSDNVVFRLSGDSNLSGASVTIDNAELQLFPDLDLGASPHTQVIKDSNYELNPGKITFLNDLSNSSNVYGANSLFLVGGSELRC